MSDHDKIPCRQHQGPERRDRRHRPARRNWSARGYWRDRAARAERRDRRHRPARTDGKAGADRPHWPSGLARTAGYTGA
nr:MAG TPA: hypothetical protein [Caudoviricetes sp.]